MPEGGDIRIEAKLKNIPDKFVSLTGKKRICKELHMFIRRRHRNRN